MHPGDEARLRDDAHARRDRRVHARRRGGGVPRTRAAGAAAPESVCRDAGKDYLLFAEEGDDYTYGDFEDKQKFKDVVKSATEFEDDFADFVAGAGMADAFSNFGDTKMRVSIGPRAVDYSDPAAPVYKRKDGWEVMSSGDGLGGVTLGSSRPGPATAAAAAAAAAAVLPPRARPDRRGLLPRSCRSM